MKKLVCIMFALLIGVSAALAEGGKNQGETGDGETSTGSNSQGQSSQDRSGR